MLPILLKLPSVNQTFPSAPDTMSTGDALCEYDPKSRVGRANSSTSPDKSIRPIFPASSSVNHIFPSGPAVIAEIPGWSVRTTNSASCPVEVTLPIFAWPVSSAM